MSAVTNHTCFSRFERVKTVTVTSNASPYTITFNDLLQYTHFELTFVNSTLNDTVPDVYTLVLPNKETASGLEFWTELECKLGRRLRVDELVALLLINLDGNVVLNVNIDTVGTVATYYNDFFRVPQYTSPSQPLTNMVQLRERSIAYTQADKNYRGL